MLYLALATGFAAGWVLCIAWQMVRYVFASNSRPMDDYPVDRRPWESKE